MLLLILFVLPAHSVLLLLGLLLGILLGYSQSLLTGIAANHHHGEQSTAYLTKQS